MNFPIDRRAGSAAVEALGFRAGGVVLGQRSSLKQMHNASQHCHHRKRCHDSPYTAGHLGEGRRHEMVTLSGRCPSNSERTQLLPMRPQKAESGPNIPKLRITGTHAHCQA